MVSCRLARLRREPSTVRWGIHPSTAISSPTQQPAQPLLGRTTTSCPLTARSCAARNDPNINQEVLAVRASRTTFRRLGPFMDAIPPSCNHSGGVNICFGRRFGPLHQEPDYVPNLVVSEVPATATRSGVRCLLCLGDTPGRFQASPGVRQLRKWGKSHHDRNVSPTRSGFSRHVVSLASSFLVAAGQES